MRSFADRSEAVVTDAYDLFKVSALSCSLDIKSNKDKIGKGSTSNQGKTVIIV